MQNNIQEYLSLLSGKSTREICAWAIEFFGREKIALSSSLGAEDQVLTDILCSLDTQMQIFTLDTGRLPQETYDTIEQTNIKYNQRLQITFPDSNAVSEMITRDGPNLFRQSIENRKLCCRIRKVEPLQNKLRNLTAWITGLRKEQATTRKDLPIIEWDEQFNLVKINPLADWTEQQVWEYIKTNHVPYNALHDQGYPSIGCDCCTRAIQSGEDVRAGRWWWESPEHKECGLHIKKS